MDTYTNGNGLTCCAECHDPAEDCCCPCGRCGEPNTRCVCDVPKAPIVAFIEARAAELDTSDAKTVRGVVACVLDYERCIDGEWGCCHSADEIAVGRCSPPSRIPALRIIAARWSGHPDYDAAWTPEED